MKTRNLFLSLFAFAAICACNKEAQPEGSKVPEILDADTYVMVNIKATGASTRAYELGEEQENAVNTVDFLFYGAREEPVTATSITWTAQTNGDNVAAKSAKIQFKAQTEKPTSMIVVLNYAGDIDALKAESLADAKATVTTTSLYKEVGTDPFYTMSNTVYTGDESNSNASEQVICEVELKDGNFGETNEKGAVADATPVDVYVERVAAKVVLTNNIDPATDVTPTDIYINGMAEATTVTPVVVGYDVVNTPDESYLFKQVDPSWTYPSWTKPADFRSFWADSYASVDYINKKYNEVHAAEVAPYVTYVHENTSETYTTKVVLTAKLTVEDGSFGAATDGNPDVLELVQYNGKYYTLNGFITEAKKVLKEGGNDIDDQPLKAVKSDVNNYEMYLALGDSHTVLDGALAETINTTLKTMVASYWNQGKCYYFTEIKHDLKASNAAEAPLLSGVVRNHVYKVSLNSIKGLGIPVSGEETETIIPEETVDKYYSLNATINILQWKIVQQGVDFNN